MAKVEVLMPKLGESVTEGTITTWLVKEGDTVAKYDPIAEVMTDKVTAEVPSSFSGTIKEIIVAEGETVVVDALIAYIEATDTDSASANGETKQETNETPVEGKNEQTANKDKQTSSSEKGPSIDRSERHRYSPAVLRLASEHGITLEDVIGTGRGGRITRKDIMQYIDQPSEDTYRSGKVAKEKQHEEKVTSSAGDTIIPITGVRKAIASNMVKSKTEIPHAWMTVEVDVTDLVMYRNEVKDAFKKREGYNLTYFAFFVQAVSQAIKEFPMMNSTWQGDQIIQRKDINISIAVAAEDELFVPVIKNTDEKSISGIAKEIATLADKARNGKLSMEDMQGGTFTVNNTGTFGSISSMGIINHPQAAILQVESIVKRPVIINDMFAARDIVNLSLSLDHRILDGLVCGRFLQRVKQLLEQVNRNSTQI